MQRKVQGILPQGTRINRVPAIAVPSGSPFWRRSRFRSAAPARKTMTSVERPECDDCGAHRNLRNMGADELGKRYLCQRCLDTNGAEYLVE